MSEIAECIIQLYSQRACTNVIISVINNIAICSLNLKIKIIAECDDTSLSPSVPGVQG